MKSIQPFMLVDGDREAMEFQMEPGTYDSSPLTGPSIYVEGDLVEVASGKVKKSTQTTPANVPELFLAGADYVQPFAKDYLLDAGVPLNVIPSRNQFVMTYKADKASGTAHTFATADFNAVVSHARREIQYQAEALGYVVTNGTSNPKVTLLGIFKGAVGDDNVQVIVRLDSNAGA